MFKPNYPKSAPTICAKFVVKNPSLPPSMQVISVRLLCVVMLALLGLSLSGCGATLPPTTSQAPPSKPAISEKLPSQTYSSSAQADIACWRKKLMDTQTMCKP